MCIRDRPDPGPGRGDHVWGRGAGGLFRGFKTHPGVLVHVPDRVYPGGDGDAVPAGGGKRAGGARDLPAHDEPLPDQAGVIHGGGRSVYEHAPAEPE